MKEVSTNGDGDSEMADQVTKIICVKIMDNKRLKKDIKMYLNYVIRL